MEHEKPTKSLISCGFPEPEARVHKESRIGGASQHVVQEWEDDVAKYVLFAICVLLIAPNCCETFDEVSL